MKLFKDINIFALNFKIVLDVLVLWI